MQGPLAAVFSGKYRGHSQYNHGKALIASLFNEQMFSVPVVASNNFYVSLWPNCLCYSDGFHLGEPDGIEVSWTFYMNGMIILLTSMADLRPSKMLQAITRMLGLPIDVAIPILLPVPTMASSSSTGVDDYSDLQPPAIAAGQEHDIKTPGYVPPLALWDLISVATTIQIELAAVRWVVRDGYLGAFFNEVWITF